MKKLYSILCNGLFVVLTTCFFAITSPAQAITLNFDFSIDVGAFSVTGEVLGLEDNATGPGTVNILSWTGFLGPFTTVAIGNNSFETSGDSILSAAYRLDFSHPDQGGGGDFLLTFNNVSPGSSGFATMTRPGFFRRGPATFTLQPTVPISPVPLPGGLVLFLTGLTGLGALRAWKKKAALA